MNLLKTCCILLVSLTVFVIRTRATEAESFSRVEEELYSDFFDDEKTQPENVPLVPQDQNLVNQEIPNEEVIELTSKSFSYFDPQEEFDKSKVHFQTPFNNLQCTCQCSPAGLSSCAEIRQKNPSSDSGYYNITVDGEEHRVFCLMGTLCGTNGGWTKVADFDMNRINEDCPPSLQLYTTKGVRHCGRKESSESGCSSIQLCSGSMEYSQVCGRVTGYQYETTDGAKRSPIEKNVNAPYIDGVSITRGDPRKHVWTFISGFSEKNPTCPCMTGAGDNEFLPEFVGDNYYCESGFASKPEKTFAVQDPLWDGKQCGANEEPCCNKKCMPWFKRDFSTPTTDGLELRVCCDEGTDDENVSIRQYAFYVK